MSEGVLISITALAAKAVIIILLLLYTLFAFIIFRQVGTMHRVVPTSVGPLLKLIAIVHFSGALIVLVLSFGIL